MCTLSVSNVIYHKFSHGAAFYTLNEKNVNVMLEFLFASPDNENVSQSSISIPRSFKMHRKKLQNASQEALSLLMMSTTGDNR